MTQEQLDRWFCYHAPTEKTAPKYKAIREAERRCLAHIAEAICSTVGDDLHGHINRLCKVFAQVVDDLCPEGDDKAAAIRCIRLARNAFNESVVWVTGTENLMYHEPDGLWLFELGKRELIKARWLANSAIACEGI